jgi:hypothetical protein
MHAKNAGFLRVQLPEFHWKRLLLRADFMGPEIAIPKCGLELFCRTTFIVVRSARQNNAYHQPRLEESDTEAPISEEFDKAWNFFRLELYNSSDIRSSRQSRDHNTWKAKIESW